MTFAACAALVGSPLDAEASRPGQDNFLKRALFADGRLWLLSDSGGLSTITEGSDRRVEVALPEPALDICARGGHIQVITCAASPCAAWTMRRWADDKWSAVASIPTKGEALAAIDCAVGKEMVLTTTRVIELGGPKFTEVKLSDELDNRGIPSVYVTQDQVFVGLNIGEWGGGLVQVERRTGKVTAVERNASGELCGGPLNAGCDPVNGIAPAPWKPGCVAAAVGLVHFSPHGRIVEVCGDRVRRIYFKAYRGSTKRRPKDDEPYETVAFFGIARVKDSLWASGIDGVYQLKDEKTVHTVALPRFKAIGNVGVSFDLPGAVLVLTGVNQRRSISGNVPLLVPR